MALQISQQSARDNSKRIIAPVPGGSGKESEVSVYKKQAVIQSFPAYDIVKREPSHFDGLVQITVDDILGLDSGKGFHRKYKPGSVVSYALQYNECPIAAVERCRERMKSQPYNGHKLHWLNQCASVICDGGRERETLVLVEVGMIVNFEGRKFELVAEPNNNLGFKAAD